MATGIGARKTNADQKYFVAPQAQDNYVTGGVSAGPTLVRFPGFGGAVAQGYNLDQTALLVWLITGAAIAVVLGVHFTFGGHRLL